MVNSPNRNVFAVLIIALIAIAAIFYLNQPVHRTSGQKIGDVIDALPQGPDAVAKQLEDRTRGQKLGDKIKKATDGN